MKNETNHLPIVLARKPLSEKSIAENVLRWGTGGINIDGCRIGTDDILGRQVSENDLGAGQYGLNDGRKTKPTNKLVGTFNDNTKGLGRFPANIIFDEEAGKILDEQSGISKSSKSVIKGGFDSKVNTYVGGGGIIESERGHNDTGGASRFFYQIKNEDKINKQINEKGKRMKNENVKLMLGDNIEKLRELPDNFVDSIITDPPYGLSFMNKKWDYDVPSVNFWKEVLRVLKPGGHVLSFGGTRTYHRMVVNMEDAGFEIRDQIMWVYGSGFPKSHNIGKAVDKIEGNDREYLGEDEIKTKKRPKKNEKEWNCYSKTKYDNSITKGNSEYEGWGTALKPAHEPICMARKPLSEKSIAENVLKWGTGGINIDGCRIAANWEDERPPSWFNSGKSKSGEPTYGGNLKSLTTSTVGERLNDGGRFPANIMFDEEAGKLLDEQSGITEYNKDRKAGNYKGGHRKEYVGTIDNDIEKKIEGQFFSDKGGASRFFYCPKTSKKERDAGLTNDIKEQTAIGSTYAGNQTTSKIGGNPDKPTEPKKNNHPTVKPLKLMEYLIKLVTPKGGVVMDCFMGSGSTGVAARNLGFKFIGIEREQEYMDIAKQRITQSVQTKLDI